MPAHRRYTKREKVTAVLAATASTVQAAAEQTGIPRKTLAYWIDQPEFAELRHKTEVERADGFRVASVLALTRLIELIPTMEARDLITFMGVASDKAQVLAGKPTDRTELVSITDGLQDHERDLLNDAIRGELARRTDARSAVDAVGAAGEARAEGTDG